MKYNNDVEIDDPRILLKDLKSLASMIGITNDEIDEIIADSKEKYGLPRDQIIKSSHPSFTQCLNDAKLELALTIVDQILTLGYDGDVSYNEMYWFAKGYQTRAYRDQENNQFIDDLMNLPYQDEIKHLGIPHAPKNPKIPKKYVDTDEYLIRQRQIHKKSDEFLNQLRQHRDDLKQFWQYQTNNENPLDAHIDALNLFDEHINNLKSFREWKSLDKEQQKIVDDIMEKLELSPLQWTINFEQLNNRGRKLLFPRLLAFFNENIDPLPIIDMYKIQFRVNNRWISKPLTSDLYAKLMTNFTEQNFIFNIDEIPPEYFYDNGGQELPQWSLFTELSFSPYEKYTGNADRGGHFFSYLTTDNCPKILVDYLRKLQIFDSLVDENGKQRPELNDCCFVYALSQTGCYDEQILNQIRLRIHNRYLSQKSIEQICQEFRIHIKLSYIDDKTNAKNKKQTNKTTKSDGSRKSYYGVPENQAIENRIHRLAIYEKHYFIDEQTPFSTYYAKHLADCENNDDMFDKEIYHNRVINGRYKVSSSQLVRLMMQQQYFKPITYGQYKVLKTVFFNELNNDLTNTSLEYDEKYCTRRLKPLDLKPSSKLPPVYFFADFEADVSGKTHKPFMCVVHKDNGKIQKTFKGDDCDKQLLDFLPNDSVIYFHNLAYDIRMIKTNRVVINESEHVNGLYKSIIKGTKTMRADIKYNGKTIHFKDSLPIITSKLSDFPKMFSIPGIRKEIFPYKYYTLDRLNNGAIGVISESGLNEDKKWTDDDFKIFITNIDNIPGCRIDDDHYDMWKYAEFYCNQDVNILRLGFTQFRNGFIKDFGIDPYKFISISSLANEVFKQRVYYPNGNLYEIGGIVRKFCSQAVYGGRCMTAYNKKWHIKKNISDFDAVSLYPSAMARLYTVEGKPKVIADNQLNIEFLSKQSAYVVEIEITKINKHYAFPLVVRKVDGLNLNDDNLNDGETVHMVVDNIALEDLIEFQEIEYRILRGYYWDGNRDYKIQDVIREIFNKRLEYKNQQNPLQLIYKLIMNSCYGKTIERPHDKDYKYVHKNDLDKYIMKNYYKIVEDIEIENSDMHAIKTMRPIDKHFNFSLLGIQVLSMSKRIMNEVMCLAFDLGCHVYYQDTDSMHIECDDLPKLVDAYREKYHRELIGSNLGQFHSDFPDINGHKEIPVSIESYFLMKKMYIDKLQDSTGEIDYMIRGKGLTQNSIRYAYTDDFNGDPMELYKYLFNNNSYTFDLTKGQPCFSMNKNMTVSTMEKFNRKIKAKYDVGDSEKYFK